MPNINLDEIKIENENEFVELIEDKTKTKSKPKRKYKKREPKQKKEIDNENEIQIENENEIQFKNEIQNEYQNYLKSNEIENENIKLQNEINLKNEIQYKIDLLKKIQKYKKIFYEYLYEIDIEKIGEKNIEELEIILSLIKDKVSSRNMENNMKHLIQLLPTVIEKSGEYIGLELSGYSNVVNSQKDYYYTCQEILIENNFYDKLNVSPSQRLLYILGSSCLLVHTTNSQNNSKISENLDKNIDSNNYSDL